MHEGHENIVSADNAGNLSERLSAININVIEENRRTEHTQICRLLSALANTDYLSYPLLLKKRQRPDFLLTCNGYNIGIEATEATHQNYREYLNHAEESPSETEKSSGVIAVPSFRHGIELKGKRKKKILNIAHTRNELDSGWAGNLPEADWSLYIKDAIAKKCERLKNKDFQKFDQNWLLIYANPPAWFVKKEELDTFIGGLWPTEDSLCFDRIFIESRWRERNQNETKPWLIALSCNGLAFFPIENIWRKAS